MDTPRQDQRDAISKVTVRRVGFRIATCSERVVAESLPDNGLGVTRVIGDDIRIAWLDHLVTCVNAYEPMVKALRAIIDSSRIDDDHSTHSPYHAVGVDEITDAVAALRIAGRADSDA